MEWDEPVVGVEGWNREKEDGFARGVVRLAEGQGEQTQGQSLLYLRCSPLRILGGHQPKGRKLWLHSDGQKGRL